MVLGCAELGCDGLSMPGTMHRIWQCAQRGKKRGKGCTPMGKEVPAATLFVMWLQVNNSCVHFCSQAQSRGTPRSGPIHSFMPGTMHRMWQCVQRGKKGAKVALLWGKEVPAATLFVMWLQVTNSCVHFVARHSPEGHPKVAPSIHSCLEQCIACGCVVMGWGVMSCTRVCWAGLGLGLGLG